MEATFSISSPRCTPLPPWCGVPMNTLDIDKDGDTIIHKDAYVSIPKSTILLPESAKDRTVQYFPPNGRARPNGTLIIGSRRGQHTTPPIGVYLSDLDLGAGSTSQRPTAPKPKVSQSSCNPWAANSRDVVPGEDLDLARIKTQDGFLESAELKDMTFSVHFGQDLELMHERTRLPIRRIDELDGQVIFKTPTGAGTAVMKANKEDESAKLNWYHELSSPIEVYENMDHA
ncbi:hypothetical protein LPUS_09654 [Lasallia pustulata]|uniref:Uncharacterized protein n=1 Tax=Lasallia pustulata TaxID=136370 RepID=A0A1W5D8C0_9LECA|nr:hypothetical protein LPUS_09654 [Lasallia pustulata]